jgi:hypothetical protein
MKIYAGAGHSFSDEVRQDANSRTLAFLEKHLATKELSQTHL